MSRGHGELQRWLLALLGAEVRDGPWWSASELAEARCRHLHGEGVHEWPRSYGDWPSPVRRTSVPWRDQHRVGARFVGGTTCPSAAALSSSIRRALAGLAGEGPVRVERVGRYGDPGTHQLIARLAPSAEG